MRSAIVFPDSGKLEAYPTNSGKLEAYPTNSGKLEAYPHKAMKREFLIEEIIFSGVSGEVRGTVEIDVQSGSIDHIDCQSYCFRRDDTDSPTILDEAKRAMAREVVEQVLSGEIDIGDERSRLIASAESSSPPTGIATATPILAEYLEAPRRTKPEIALRRRAQ